MGRCAAKSKQSGKRCRKSAVRGKRVCHMHGGLSTGPRVQKAGGRYSKYLPTRLAADYQAALSDRDLGALREKQALIEAFICENLADQQAGRTSAQLWKDAAEASATLERIIGESEDPATRESLSRLQDVIHNGVGRALLRAELMELIERGRRLSETESRAIAQKHQHIDIRQAAALLGAVVAIIKENVRDPELRARISRGIGGLVASRN